MEQAMLNLASNLDRNVALYPDRVAIRNRGVYGIYLANTYWEETDGRRPTP